MTLNSFQPEYVVKYDWPILLSVCWMLAATQLSAGEPTSDVRFRRLTLSEEFFSEGADVSDFDGDGHLDIVSGPFWYQGPTFRQRHRYTSGDRVSIKAYSKHFFSFAHDFDGDERPDILVVGMPGDAAHWFQNPGDDSTDWPRHHVIGDAGGESPTLTDLTGDGKPELVCVHGGRFGYAEPDWQSPTRPWTFTAVSDDRGYGRFTHGLGVGDVNGDGRADVLETNGWYAQPKQLGDPFIAHEQRFSQSGGAQMFAYDFDGDGDNDVVSTQNAHGWGLTWFQRRGQNDDMLWVPHPILTDKPIDNEYGVAISQLHAVALADIDGDGVKDLITGKRYFAHGGADPGAFQLPVLYWFRTVRDSDGVRFEPHLIDRRIGVGTQLTVADLNNDGRNDIVVGNKLGTYVLINERAQNERVPNERVPNGRVPHPLLGSGPGTEDFTRIDRQSKHLAPEQERQTFLLPPGFDAQLVAAEPEIAKPLNMAFDSRGRLWVTCTTEYPYPVKVGQPGADTIKILEDQNGDGRADKITTFADGLNIPIGLYPYKDGVICFSIPYIWHLRDTDGDGKCDQRKKLYGPFDHTRDTHGLCNSFTRGYDGWMYACHGFNNQSTVAGTDGHQVTMQSGNTFRFRLDGSRIEQFTHGQVNPFGLSYDARGNLLSADCHTKPVTLLMPGGYYESFGKPHDGLGFVPDVMNHLHGSTAIGGIAVCTDHDSFPGVYQNSAFGGNVMTSRVNRNSLVYHGSSLQAQEESDFLIAGDPWFRPVDLKFGPDGSMYIADFYNRVIGHYELPLDHPGRDRTSGRIWRIVYRGDQGRRDAGSQAKTVETPNLNSLGIDGLITELNSPYATQRMLAQDRIVDHVGRTAIGLVRQAFEDHVSANVRIHAMWVLQRLDAITPEDLAAATGDADSLVRTHAYRLIGELPVGRTFVRDLLIRGIGDHDAGVRRAAVHASSRHLDLAIASALMDQYRKTSLDDPHLRHAIRMSLRDNLQVSDVFQNVANNVSPDQVDLIAGVCLSLKTSAAGQFIAQHIDALSAGDKQRLSEYLRFAITRVSGQTADAMVTIAREKFAHDRDMQLELLGKVDLANVHRDKSPSKPIPQSILNWADDIARQLLAFDQQTSPLSWTSVADGGTEDPTEVWAVSDRRQLAGQTGSTLLWSSFPYGEQQTGIFRSAPFALPQQFSFYIAGHDGVPDQPLQNKNFVCVRDAKTQQVLYSWSPPRNDVAQQRTWNQPVGTPQDYTGRSVYLELVDGDPGSAYAWMAIGRFSIAELDPSELLQNRRTGAELAGRFGLRQLRDDLIRLGRASQDSETRTALIGAVANMQQDSRIKAMAEALRIESLDRTTQLQIIGAIANNDPASESLAHALRTAVSLEQLRVARQLVIDRPGAESLLALVSAGDANVRLLIEPEIQSRLEALVRVDQQKLIESLTAGLQEEDAGLDELIRHRQANFVATGGDKVQGKQIFGKHCAVCHQVGGEGNQVGPNLDGIGNRGLSRICEDVLAPHRNVDAAFRSWTILTDDGRALAGLIKSESDSQLRLFDTTGKQHVIDQQSVESRKQSMRSPMPSNFAQIIEEPQWRNLLSYLLSLVQ